MRHSRMNGLRNRCWPKQHATCADRQARARWRAGLARSARPIAKNPTINMSQVAGSGTSGTTGGMIGGGDVGVGIGVGVDVATGVVGTGTGVVGTGVGVTVGVGLGPGAGGVAVPVGVGVGVGGVSPGPSPSGGPTGGIEPPPPPPPAPGPGPNGAVARPPGKGRGVVSAASCTGGEPPRLPPSGAGSSGSSATASSPVDGAGRGAIVRAAPVVGRRCRRSITVPVRPIVRTMRYVGVLANSSSGDRTLPAIRPRAGQHSRRSYGSRCSSSACRRCPPSIVGKPMSCVTKPPLSWQSYW